MSHPNEQSEEGTGNLFDAAAGDAEAEKSALAAPVVPRGRYKGSHPSCGFSTSSMLTLQLSFPAQILDHPLQDFPEEI